MTELDPSQEEKDRGDSLSDRREKTGQFHSLTGGKRPGSFTEGKDRGVSLREKTGQFH